MLFFLSYPPLTYNTHLNLLFMFMIVTILVPIIPMQPKILYLPDKDGTQFPGYTVASIVCTMVEATAGLDQ